MIPAGSGRVPAAWPAREVVIENSPHHFPWLDGLRLLAALSVLCFHLMMVGGVQFPQGYPWWPLHMGMYGVDVFFVISGVVVTLALTRQRAASPDAYRRTFLIQRVVRILPLLVVTMAVDILLNHPRFWEGPQPWLTLLAHLTFVHNLFPSTHGAINGPSWTLGLEMQFYLLLAALASVWWWRRGAWVALLAALAIAVFWRLACLSYAQQLPPEIAGQRSFQLATQLPGVLDGFAGGVMLALIHLRFRGAFRQGPRWLLLLGCALACWILLIELTLAHVADYWLHQVSVVWAHLLTTLAATLTAAACMQMPMPVRGRAVLDWCGRLTYGVYLWHMPVLVCAVRIGPDLAPALRALVVAAVIAVLAPLGWRLIEQPALRWGRRFSRSSL